jgi:hypothetical protein
MAKGQVCVTSGARGVRDRVPDGPMPRAARVSPT